MKSNERKIMIIKHIYYKAGMLGEQLLNVKNPSVLTDRIGEEEC